MTTTSVTQRRLSSYCTRGEHTGCATAKAKCRCACHGLPPSTVDPEVRRAAARRRHALALARATAAAAMRPQIRKEDAPCCTAQRDGLGRLPIGFCGPECVRRPS